MMQYINEHHNIETAFAVRYRCTIELLDGDRSISPQANIDPTNRDVWSLVSYESSEPAITRTNIKHAGVPRY